MPNTQLLRASFQALAADRRRPASRPARRAARPPAAAAGRALPPPAGAPARRDVSTAAVRADAAADTVDTSTIQLIADITKAVDAAHGATLTASREAVAAGVTVGGTGDEVSTTLRKKVRASILDLQSGLLERETEVRLLLLAALCGEHLLLLGPPGTAKSELSRRLSALTGGRYFERLLTRFSVPEELFGPLSMRGLENDEYVRQIEGYLPTAEVAFIDEIFKANSAILNALLTLLNERLFDNGSKRLAVPLLCLVGASNELPESEELDALYDRFLIRRRGGSSPVQSSPVQPSPVGAGRGCSWSRPGARTESVAQVSAGQLATLARLAAGRLEAGALTSTDAEDEAGASNGAGGAAAGELTMEDFRTAADHAYGVVDVPESVIDLLTGIRNYLQARAGLGLCAASCCDKCEPPVYVSDRRFMKAVRMLQVAAYADGRDAVHEYDCLLLEHALGQRPDDAHKVRAFLLETIASDPGLQQTELLFLGLFGRACRVLDGGAPETLDGGFPELRHTVWQSASAVQAAVQALTPQMTENKARVEDLLREALLLQAALDRGVSAGLLERLLPKRFKQYQKGISGRV
eukprot:scaffold5.g959.t1